MTANKHHWTLTILLIIVVCANLLNVTSARADGETPTEPPAPTQVETEPPVESTPEPVEATATPVAEVLTQIPEGTEVVVLDEEGNSVPLATEEAAEIAEIVDPMWCPAGVLPGGAGCSINFSTISALLTSMRGNASNYDEAGVIYFTVNPGSQSFTLTDAGGSLGSSYDTLKNFNLTLQGGWDGASTSYSGQTNFTTRPLTIGTNTNPWIGNLTLNDFVFTSASATSLTIYTTTGNITLNNVDVNSQGSGNNTALINTTTGNINVSNGTYDGNGSNSSGFSATTGGGSITISNSSFTDNVRPSNAIANGATLSAPIVTLVNVASTGNDGSGVFFTGSSLFINGGTFSTNQRYGVEVASPANSTIYLQSAPTCVNNTLGCYNDATVSDNTAPVITANVSGTVGLNGWYTSDVSVSWSATDAESGILSSTGCTASNLTSNTAGTTLTCSATNNMGLSNSASVTIKIDKNAPVLSLPSDISTSANGPIVVNYSASATDNLDSSVSAICSPASGSTFSLGTTAVNCFATDDAGNMSLGSFQVTVVDNTTVVVTPTSPAPISTSTGSGTSTSGSSTSDSSNSQSNPSPFIIPLTGGEVINLDCKSTFWAFGIKLSFANLCDYQTTLNSINANNLPGQMPDGFTFLMGLDVQILSENQAVERLPDGTSILLGFPISGAKDEFAVLWWNGSEWTEISSQTNDIQGFYQVITTDQTGSFVLVKK